MNKDRKTPIEAWLSDWVQKKNSRFDKVEERLSNWVEENPTLSRSIGGIILFLTLAAFTVTMLVSGEVFAVPAWLSRLTFYGLLLGSFASAVWGKWVMKLPEARRWRRPAGEGFRFAVDRFRQELDKVSKEAQKAFDAAIRDMIESAEELEAMEQRRQETNAHLVKLMNESEGFEGMRPEAVRLLLQEQREGERRGFLQNLTFFVLGLILGIAAEVALSYFFGI
jgi:hypothetical protein